MNRFFILVCIALIGSGTALAETLTLIGTIDEKLGIHMSLTIDGGAVTGMYSYDRFKQDIALMGEVDGSGNLNLTELDGEGNTTGVFRGKFTSQKKIEGMWSPPDGKRLLPFVVSAPEETEAGAAEMPAVAKTFGAPAETEAPAEGIPATPEPGSRTNPNSNASTVAVNANAEPDQVSTVRASGIGKDEKGAEKNAFQRAVENVVGVVVDAETLIQNDAVVRDNVLTYSDAYIEKFETLESGENSDGLWEVHIEAQVRRRKLIEKIKTLNMTVKDVDTTSLYAKLMTEDKAQADAGAMVAKLMSDINFPESVLEVKMLKDTPDIVEREGDEVTVNWPIEVRINEDAYYNSIVPKMMEVLTHVAKDVSSSPIIFNTEEGTLSNDRLANPVSWHPASRTLGETDLNVYVVTRASAKLKNISCMPFILDDNALSAVCNDVLVPSGFERGNAFTNYQQPILIEILWLDAAGKTIIEDRLDITKDEYGNSSAMVRFGTDIAFGDSPIYIGFSPFIFLRSPFDYVGDAYTFGYQREVTLDELKQTTQLKCSVVGRN